LATFPELRYELHMSGFRLAEVRPHAYQTDKLSLRDYARGCGSMRGWVSEEKDAAQRERTKNSFKLHSPSALFGECLLLLARKVYMQKL